VKPTPDGIVIQGGAIQGEDMRGNIFGGGTVDSEDDHRIAMSFAVAGLRAKDSILIKNCNNVATSFPGFVALANQAGLKIVEEKR